MTHRSHKTNYLGPSRKGGAFLTLSVSCSESQSQSQSALSVSCSESQSQSQSALSVNLVEPIELVNWLHGRGHNFCLQKSRMPLAGLVYLPIIFHLMIWVKCLSSNKYWITSSQFYVLVSMQHRYQTKNGKMSPVSRLESSSCYRESFVPIRKIGSTRISFHQSVHPSVCQSIRPSHLVDEKIGFGKFPFVSSYILIWEMYCQVHCTVTANILVAADE